MMKWIERLSLFLRRYRDAQIALRAAALAYHTLLGLVPMVGLVFWYLKEVGITERWLELVRKFVLAQLNVGSSEMFMEHFHTLTGSISGNSWGWVGMLLLAYTASTLVVRFGDSLDFIMGQKSSITLDIPSRAKVFLKRTAVMLGLPLALTLSLAVGQWIRKDSLLHHLFDLEAVGPYFALIIPFAVDTLVFTAVYRLVPRRVVSTGQAFRAALIVAPVSELTRFLFGVYNSYAVSVHKIYGVLAVIPMFILWVQIAWMVILSGALIIDESRRKRAAR